MEQNTKQNRRKGSLQTFFYVSLWWCYWWSSLRLYWWLQWWRLRKQENLFVLESSPTVAQINKHSQMDQLPFGALDKIISFLKHSFIALCIKKQPHDFQGCFSKEVAQWNFLAAFLWKAKRTRFWLYLWFSVEVINDDHSNAFCANSKKVKTWISIKDTPRENINFLFSLLDKLSFHPIHFALPSLHRKMRELQGHLVERRGEQGFCCTCNIKALEYWNIKTFSNNKISKHLLSVKH